MMESSVSLGKVVTVGLWIFVGGLLVASWVTWLLGAEGIPFMLGFTACAFSAAAAVAHIRCYNASVCSLMRLVARDLGGSGSGIRPLRE